MDDLPLWMDVYILSVAMMVPTTNPRWSVTIPGYARLLYTFLIHSRFCLTSQEGKWYFMPPMINRRSNCGFSELGNKLYAVGGNEGSLCMNTVERFDVTANKWEIVASMQSKR